MCFALAEAAVDNPKKQQRPGGRASTYRESTKGEQASWTLKHKRLRESEGLPDTDPAATRVSDLISITEGLAMKKSLSEFPGEKFVMPEMYSDTSQDASCLPWCTNGLRSLTTSSEFWSHRLGRHLIPCELFTCVGFKKPQLTGLSHSMQKDLLGECMSVPASTVALLSLLTSLPDYWSGLSSASHLQSGS